MKNRWLGTLTILTLAMFSVVGVRAQDDAPPQDAGSPQYSAPQDSVPNTTQGDDNEQQYELKSSVARVSLIHGDVSTQRGDSGEWAAATLNTPIVSGDKVSTGGASRAEVQLDFANLLRLGDNAQATVANITRTDIQIQLGQGVANYDVFKDSEANAEIDTPNASLHPARKDGSYRIYVRPDGDTEIIVRKGEAEVSTPQGSKHVYKGDMITVHGDGNNVTYRVSEAPSRDDWDKWNSDRDNVIHTAVSWNHTNRYYTGSEDLDAYGRWTSVPDYGQVWVPTAGPGFVPYRDGRWVWEPGWGWTWVSYEPWGWAPYHYGRWFMYGSSWAWWPGPVYGGYGYGGGYYGRPYRPIWAPAYVSFFGFGGRGGFSVGFGFGSFGWLPSGPCDRFYPWWGGRRNNFNVVNITNIYNIHNGGFRPLHPGNAYSNLRLASVNERVRGGISTVPANGFGTGRVRPVALGNDGFRNGHFMTGNLPVVPTRESLNVSNRPASPTTVRGGQPARFFSNARRPTAAPESFDRQASQVQQSIQRDGHFTPVRNDNNNRAAVDNRPTVGTQPNRPVSDASGRPSNIGQGNGNGNDRNPGMTPKPSPSTPAQPGRGDNNGRVTPGNNVPRPGSSMTNGSTNMNEGWRRLGDRSANQPQAAPGQNNPAQGQNNERSVPRPSQNTPSNTRPSSSNSNSTGNESWRHLPGQGSNGNSNGNSNVSRPSNSTMGRSNTPSGRGGNTVPRPGNSTTSSPRPSSNGNGNGNSNSNQDWRRSTSPSGPASSPRSERPSSNGNDSWRHSTSPQSSPRPSSPSMRGERQSSSSNEDWRRSAPQSRSSEAGNFPSRGDVPRPGNSGNSGGSSRSYSRPQIDMRQPVVVPRSSQGGYSGGGYSGGGRSSGSSHSAPSGGGSHSAPSGGSHSSPSGGSHSTPSSSSHSSGHGGRR